MIRYMLDTNICIAAIRHKDDRVLTRIKECSRGDIGISVVTLAELEFGVEKSQHPLRNRLALSLFVTEIRILPFNNLAAACYGKIRSNLELAGTPIGALDTMIAAHALSIEATIVTRNEREFLRVSGLSVENWLSAPPASK